MAASESKKPGFFGKDNKKEMPKTGKPDNSYKETTTPKNAFSPTFDETHLREDSTHLLKTNNKSFVVPAEIWCEFMALLEISDNDYTYELLAEMSDMYKKSLNQEELLKFEKESNDIKRKQADKFRKKMDRATKK